MLAARPALVALAAANQGIDGHPLAWLQVLNVRADLHHFPGAFVADHPGEAHNLGADAAYSEVVCVGAADAHRRDFEPHVASTRQMGFRGLANFDSPDARQKGSSHICSGRLV
jgi:hypothetical protein